MNDFVSLCRNSEFQRLYRRGRSAVRPTMVVYSAKGRGARLRLGITAGKKVGGAVVRNRAKRRIRELFRIKCGCIKKGTDICIVARPRIVNARHDKVVDDFMSAMTELELLNENEKL